MEQLCIRNANDAKTIAYGHLEMQLYPKKVVDVSFARVWFSEETVRDVWELEGKATVKGGLLRTQTRHFRLLIDPITCSILGFEQREFGEDT